MKTYEAVLNTFKGKKTPGVVPVVPIYHTAASIGSKVSLLDYASKPDKMAELSLWAYETLKLDGVQLTLGVACEAESMGAKTTQSEKGLPAIVAHLLEDKENFKKLRVPDPMKDGRMPGFIEAVKKTQEKLRGRGVVVANIRGPFIIAGQL